MRGNYNQDTLYEKINYQLEKNKSQNRKRKTKKRDAIKN